MKKKKKCIKLSNDHALLSKCTTTTLDSRVIKTTNKPR